jgi:hypothetical protein
LSPELLCHQNLVVSFSASMKTPHMVEIKFRQINTETISTKKERKITRSVGQRAEVYLIYVNSTERSGRDWPKLLAGVLNVPVTG